MRSRAKRRGRAGGFTLIELLIVVAVIGIIAAISVPSLLTAMDRAKQTGSAALLRGFGFALESYAQDNHRYPSIATVGELIPVLTPYSDTLRAVDDWKNPLGYVTDGTHYTIECYGKDGVDGLDVTPRTRYQFTLDIVYSDGAFTASVD